VITPQILFISTFLSLTWGIFLVASVMDYRGTLVQQHSRRDVVIGFRRMLVAFCIWLICFAYVFRTICVLAGVGEGVAGQITFFALLGTNVVGSLFAVISLKYD